MASKLSLFLAELKRRKVYPVATFYVLLAAGLLGLGDAALPSDLWDEIQKRVGVTLLIGFPIALLLSWASRGRPFWHLNGGTTGHDRLEVRYEDRFGKYVLLDGNQTQVRVGIVNTGESPVSNLLCRLEEEGWLPAAQHGVPIQQMMGSFHLLCPRADGGGQNLGIGEEGLFHILTVSEGKGDNPPYVRPAEVGGGSVNLLPGGGGFGFIVALLRTTPLLWSLFFGSGPQEKGSLIRSWLSVPIDPQGARPFGPAPLAEGLSKPA